MLTTYLKNIPYTKCVIIQDSVQERGNDFLIHIINSHLKLGDDSKVIYCEFEFNRYLHRSGSLERVERHDFICTENDATDIDKLQNFNNCVIVIDSLAHMVFRFGPQKTYRILQKLKRSNGIKQIIGLLHSDLFDENDDVFRYFEHLSTLHVTLEPKLKMQLPRVVYAYKKSGGKIIKDVEQYKFEQTSLITMPIEKVDPKTLIEEIVVSPETLTTFKIGLDDRDKQSREKLVLPYLPKDENETGGNIIYEFDDVDDWDEEDPDDDLDI